MWAALLMLALMALAFVFGEVGVYRRGGYVYEWTRRLDRYVPRGWK